MTALNRDNQQAPNPSPDERAADYAPDAERAGISRRGTGVMVRLQADDLNTLDALCATSGKSRPEVLRLGLTALTAVAPPPTRMTVCEDITTAKNAPDGVCPRCGVGLCWGPESDHELVEL